jgi:hypothetical protein
MVRLLIASLAVGAVAVAQPAGANYDESKVPKYTLPDPLVMKNGSRVRDAKTWQTRRRPEVFELPGSRPPGGKRLWRPDPPERDCGARSADRRREEPPLSRY